MRTITHTVYTYDELSPEAQAKARDWYRDGEEYEWLGEYMREELDTLFEQYKITDAGTELRYSLNYSQGDGASFTGDIEWGVWRVSVVTNHWGIHYSHSRSVRISSMTSMNTDREAPRHKIDELETIIEAIGDKLEKAGYDYVEACDANDAVAENIRANEYEFYADGSKA